MAIEITPAKGKKMPLWVAVSAAIIAVTLLAFLGTYLFFYFSGKKIASNVEEINNSIIPLEEAIKQKENALALHQQRISDFKALLLKHKKVENVFAFLEKNTIPAVWFSDFEMSEEGISLQGKSPSFLTIEQQIGIFSEQEEVKKVNLSDISINEDGQIEFSMEISFSPAIYNYNFYPPPF